MALNLDMVGFQIQSLRKSKGYTQNQLGDLVGVSFQAVSKWERGETLPDLGTLIVLSEVLDISIDQLLHGVRKRTDHKGRKTIDDIKKGLNCLLEMGNLLGRENLLYRAAIQGIDSKMNIEIEDYLSQPYTYEGMVAEAAIQAILSGYYIDPKDIEKGFISEHWRTIVKQYAADAQN